MTVVVYDRREGVLSMRGHAGAGEKGSDLVCAALSILLYTFAAIPGTRLRSGEGWAVAELAKTASSGMPGPENGRFVKRPYGGTARASSDAICAGFRLLAEAYPRNVKYREVNA